MPVITTKQAALLCGDSASRVNLYLRVHYLLRRGYIKPLPSKNASGDYVWDADDLQRLTDALRVDRRFRSTREEASHA
jgi:hypothetical protein